jgi:hypothetical protein
VSAQYFLSDRPECTARTIIRSERASLRIVAERCEADC